MNSLPTENSLFPDHTLAGKGGLKDESIKIMVDRFPELAGTADSLRQACRATVESLAGDGTLFLAGNGGSLADCLHIAGELKKSFERTRTLPRAMIDRLREFPNGPEISVNLQAGLRAIVLGCVPVLAYAVDNDIEARFMQFAQELYALARPGDVFLGISTSGKAKNVLNCATVAQAAGLPVILFTGQNESPLSELADHVLRVPSTKTAEIQSLHSQLYHVYCRVIEDTLFG